MRPLRQFTEAQLRTRTSLKWSTYPDDVLPLWVAEMDAPLPEVVRTALRDVVDRDDLGYPLTGTYRAAFARFAQQRWGWATEAGLEVADVMSGLKTAIEIATEPGGVVVVSPPVYAPFYEVIAWAGRRAVFAPLDQAGRLDPDRLDDALAAAGPGAAYLLCNPHNPTATVPTADELDTVIAIAAARDARVIVDEIHAPLVAEGFVPYLSRPGTERAFVATSASKAFNLAGIKAGLLLAGAEAAAELEALPPLAGYGAGHLALTAHAAALDAGGPWLDALATDLSDHRALLRDLLTAHLPEVSWNGERGSYLAWLEFPADWGDDPAGTILERGRVALSSGPGFGPGGERHARLNYATTPQILEQAVERIAQMPRTLVRGAP